MKIKNDERLIKRIVDTIQAIQKLNKEQMARFKEIFAENLAKFKQNAPKIAKRGTALVLSFSLLVVMSLSLNSCLFGESVEVATEPPVAVDTLNPVGGTQGSNEGTFYVPDVTLPFIEDFTEDSGYMTEITGDILGGDIQEETEEPEIIQTPETTKLAPSVTVPSATISDVTDNLNALIKKNYNSNGVKNDKYIPTVKSLDIENVKADDSFVYIYLTLNLKKNGDFEAVIKLSHEGADTFESFSKTQKIGQLNVIILDMTTNYQDISVSIDSTNLEEYSNIFGQLGKNIELN